MSSAASTVPPVEQVALGVAPARAGQHLPRPLRGEHPVHHDPQPGWTGGEANDVTVAAVGLH
jgi:hypothetical protein